MTRNLEGDEWDTIAATIVEEAVAEKALCGWELANLCEGLANAMRQKFRATQSDLEAVTNDWETAMRLQSEAGTEAGRLTEQLDSAQRLIAELLRQPVHYGSEDNRMINLSVVVPYHFIRWAKEVCNGKL